MQHRQRKKGGLKSKDIILKEIKDTYFNAKKGLIAQSVRDFDKYQGADGHYRIGLLFCPVMLNESIVNKDIKDKGKELLTQAQQHERL
jgi:hypothetical protein